MAALRATQPKADKKPHLTDYYYMLRKRVWLILSFLLGALVLGALVSFSMRPVYKATAKIVVDKESYRSPLTGQPLDAENYMSQQMTFKTHFTMISSHPVLAKVLERLNLTDEGQEPPSSEMGPVARFFDTIKSNLDRLWTTFFQPSQVNEFLAPEESALEGRISRLRGKIQVEEIKDTRLLHIHVYDENPQMARDMANAVAESYIFYDSATRIESSRRILDWLSRQLYEMKRKVEDAERLFQNYKEQENIFSIEGRQKINVQKIEEVNADYIKTKSQRMEVEAKISELKKFIVGKKDGEIRNIPTFLKDDLLEKLYAEMLSTEVEYQRISGVYRHKHPELVKVTSKINELQSKIRQQLQKTLSNAESEKAVLTARENALQQAMNSYESEAINTNRKDLQYGILERELKTNQELYNTLLAKVKEANITDEITKTNLRIVETATAPILPIRPDKVFNFFLSLVLGLLGGVGLVFFLEYLDQSIHNKEEAQKRFDLPVLSEIPFQKSGPPSKDQATAGRSFPLLSELPASNHFSEAFRRLATNLRFSQPNRARKVFLVTSSTAKEGKSTITLNLGLTMAKIGLKTLVVEADLRLPTMRKTLHLPEKTGMTDILVDGFNMEVREGTLDQWAISDLHKLMEIQEKTGILHYRNEVNAFDVSFAKGRLIDVGWQAQPADERLATLLIQSGRISKEQAQIALEKHHSSCQKLHQVILKLGLMTPEALAGPQKLLIEENIRELCRCQQADFIFEEDASIDLSSLDSKESALYKAIGDIHEAFDDKTPFLFEQVHRHLIQIPDNNLWILPSGKIPPNPAELLASNRTRVLVELLRRQFDLILIDSPPLSTVSDSVVLSSLVDGVMMVIRAGVTHVALIERAKEQLEAIQVPIIGTILNMLDFEKDPYYYGRYYHRYKEYYDNEEPKDQASYPS
jgi:polysaccharide biosynthesis transport protein